MALSNWLTRDEWNACYFAGIKEALEGKPFHNLGEQLHLGIGALHRAGYEFRGIDSTAEGDYTKVNQCSSGNERVLVEILDGTIDILGRAKETMIFAAKELPQMDWSWLKEEIDNVNSNNDENKID